MRELALSLLSLLLFALVLACNGAGYRGNQPPGCDTEAALQCEYNFLLCKIFGGPANDKPTLCRCAGEFYGSCLRLAGCETANEVGPLTLHQIYMKTCVDFIMENDCPDPLICAINCASDASIDPLTTKIIPFNNYGQYHLRIKTCLSKVHEERLSRYSVVQQDYCKRLDDFEVCSRWIPPSTFVPVALPINTTYIEIDSCEILADGTHSCPSSLTPTKIYGNRFLFPKSFDVAQTNSSSCSSDADCLGSFCDFQFSPSICSPKKIEQALGTGSQYMTMK